MWIVFDYENNDWLREEDSDFASPILLFESEPQAVRATKIVSKQYGRAADEPTCCKVVPLGIVCPPKPI